MCKVKFYGLEINNILADLILLLPVMIGNLVYILSFLLSGLGNIVIKKSKEFVISWVSNASFLFFLFPY